MLEINELPQVAQEKLKLISQTYQKDITSLVKEYDDEFNSKWIQSDEQFKTDEDRHAYVSLILWTRYSSRQQVEDVDVIPVGYFRPRPTKTGSKMSSLFVIAKRSNNFEKARISLLGEMAEIVNSISLGVLYTVKLGTFTSGDLSADDRTKFENPKRIDISLGQIIQKYSKRVTIATARDYPTLIGSDGYPNNLDWRVINGVVIDLRKGTSEKGNEWAFYRIADDSVGTKETTDPKTGEIIRPGMTLWADPKMLIYERESQCDFCTTITLDKETKEPSGNIISIAPIHVKELRT